MSKASHLYPIPDLYPYNRKDRSALYYHICDPWVNSRRQDRSSPSGRACRATRRITRAASRISRVHLLAGDNIVAG